MVAVLAFTFRALIISTTIEQSPTLVTACDSTNEFTPNWPIAPPPAARLEDTSSNEFASAPTAVPTPVGTQAPPVTVESATLSTEVVTQSLPLPSETLDPPGSSGPCEGEGNACTGDVTHWDGGVGACGWAVDTDRDMQVALPHAMMGTQSNGNPYCGRSLTIRSPSGQKISATVGDKCMGCESRSIDLTDALFQAVVPFGDGRVSNIQWWFN